MKKLSGVMCGFGSRNALGVALLWIAVQVTPAAGVRRLVPEEYPTIQAAIDEAVPGDTVLVGQGTFSGSGNCEIEFRGKAIVLTSRGGWNGTVLDCGGHRGFYIHEAEPRAATIDGLTIRNGWAHIEDPGVGGAGGGIFCGPANVTITNCVVEHSTADYAGGAIYVIAGDVRVANCVFHGNTADEGGAIRIQSGAATIEECVVVNNLAGLGGGIMVVDSGLDAQGCTVAGNTASRGGGLEIMSPTEVGRSIIWGNVAFAEGDDIDALEAGNLHCCAVDSSHVSGQVSYDEFCIFGDPLFCGNPGCDWTNGSPCWTLHADSPCLPEHSPCGALIGALGEGCGPAHPVGACCMPDGSCGVLSREECSRQGGSYQGDESTCTPNPCEPTPTRATTWGHIKSTFR